MKAKNSNINNAYNEYTHLDLNALDLEVLRYWEEGEIFEKSIEYRKNAPNYVFYEGPPSINGMPGIHHVMSRTIKDIFARYKTLKGFRVDRKGGWDTHGLPIELEVEKRLGISKKDIGDKISVEEYNNECRKQVGKFKKEWDEITTKMGYWVDLDHPYITYENYYIESLWALIKRLYDKGLMYKGYTIQPFSPAAGTQLSSHELNQPGAYRDVKDTTVVAQFKISNTENDYFLAWTTTPWTLPSNTALAVGKGITYQKIKTFNPYTYKPVQLILAKDLRSKYFPDENAELVFEDYKEGDKKIPWIKIEEMKGSDLEGLKYEQLLPFSQPDDGDAFKVIIGDFVTTEDGTGVVHLAPSFGSDDMRVAKMNGIGSLTLVDKQGKFNENAGEFSGRYVKNYTEDPDYVSVDIDIAVKLKQENKAFKVEKYEHSYPHCWRTDKPVIYYPLDSWFIKTTAVKERMVELNKTINWKPKSTGEGRFGQWLENVIDWNLSRTRFWGTPLPIWRTEDGSAEKCIGSVSELKNEIAKSIEAGYMNENIDDDFDLHKPFVDSIYLVSDSGQKMTREADLIDVWFDSGAMPYAQWGYPIANEEKFKENFPADFIAEGVDQTRGWFYTLHALSTMLFDSVAYKNVISNGLVQDKNGQKMSKRLGNAVNPFETIDKYGADATRWYMISNAAPWDNLKFDIDGVDEVRRKHFGTLYNTYSFFALYANIDQFTYAEDEIAPENRPEIDRWILSLLNSLIVEVDDCYNDFEPSKAARAISHFVDENLSNWYVRLCRRRFWKGEYSSDKISAYQTLYTCLEVIMQLMSPVTPFFTDFIFGNLNRISNKLDAESVHLSDFPTVNESLIDTKLEERMKMAQDISSMILSLRKRESIKVRQPLQKILIPILNEETKNQLDLVKDYILNEVNVKEIEFVDDASGIIKKKVKPNFKTLGPKYGKLMKQISSAVSQFTDSDVAFFEKEGRKELQIEGDIVILETEDLEITTEDIEGWLVSSNGSLTVALDVHISEELEDEGIAREFVNRIQNIRKEKDFNVTDRINIVLNNHEKFTRALNSYKNYICTEILAEDIQIVDELSGGETVEVNDIELQVKVEQKN